MLLPKTPILIVHLLGLCLSIGPVLVLDMRLSRLLFGARVRHQDIEIVSCLAPFVRLGLILLWISGAGFLLFYAYDAPEALTNPKLHAKLVIVTILTANGLLIERYAFAQLMAREGTTLLDPDDRRQRLTLLFVGAVSATSWYTPMLLGVMRELNFACDAATILSAFATSVAGAFGGLWSLARLRWTSMLGGEPLSDAVSPAIVPTPMT